MKQNNHYVYDSDKCEFVPVNYPKREEVVHTFSVWLLSGVVIACICIAVLSHSFGSPAELVLKAENNRLIEHLESTRGIILNLEHEIQDIASMDNEMYRSVLGMDPISDDLRNPGTGGVDPYSEYDLYSKNAAEILKWTSARLDHLERRVNVQKMSFEEIKSYYNENTERLSHLPAIRPLNGVLLSGFGMRIHPVFKYKRMHEGIDFRADVGTEIFATGDGVVEFSARRGTYGNLLIIDHGFGYSTRYAHLSGFAEGIRPGAKVERGQLVGYSGNTGLTQGPHLHYEVRLNNQPVDPLNFLFADTSPEEYLMYQEVARSNPTSMD